MGVEHAPSFVLSGADAFAADRFHPSAETYRRWAAHLATTAVPLLGS